MRKGDREDPGSPGSHPFRRQISSLSRQVSANFSSGDTLAQNSTSNRSSSLSRVVFREVKLPDDRLIIPGVLDSTTNFIEHPELVAQRLVRYAEVVGRERVIAGTDCGFATFARSTLQVEPEITWAKFRSMAEGARLASAQLWR